MFPIAISARSAKVLHQRDLPLRERSRLRPDQREDADGGPLAQQRHAEDCAKPAYPGDLGVLGIPACVRDMDRRPVQRRPADPAVAAGQVGADKMRRHGSGRCPDAVGVVLQQVDRRAARVAERARRGRQHGQHGIETEGRAADRLQHVGGGGLLPQPFADLRRARLHLVGEPHVLDRDHRLVGQGFYQPDLQDR